MSYKTWQALKTCYCQHVDQDVSLEAEVVYPAERLPDQSPRILAHRCSRALECNLDGRSSCLWSGTNPTIDSFLP